MKKQVSICPKCNQEMEQGFCHRASGLYYIRPEKLKQFAFKDEDLIKAGFRKILPSKAEYYMAYLCEACGFFCVDFSKSLGRKEANEMAGVI